MVGSATLTIVRSTIVMKNATASKAKARQRRTSPGIAASPRLTLSLRSTEVTCVSDPKVVRSSLVETPAELAICR